MSNLDTIDNLVTSAYSKYKSVVEGLEEFQVFDTDNVKLHNLELYNLVSREEIISMFNEQGIPFVNCRKSLEPEELHDLIDKIKSYGFFIHSYNKESGQITLVTDYYKADSKENIVMYLRNLSASIKYITPLNYSILSSSEDSVIEDTIPMLYFKRIIYDAMEKRASDVHFTNNQNRDNGYDYRVCYRLLNDYVEQKDIYLNRELNNKMIVSVINDYTTAESADLDTSFGVETSWLNAMRDNSCDLRLTCSKTNGGYTMVVRIQRMSTVGKGIENLGFNKSVQEALSTLASKNTGMTIITGAPRTGKSTTMVAMINSRAKSLIKREEYSSPVEVILPHEQLDYGDDVTTLLNYIKLAKKQDIDITIINELPDSRLAMPILDLVNSSMGVLTTFHINRLWNAPLKLKSYFGDWYIDLITQINGVVNQKMFVRQCPHCLVEKSIEEKTSNLPKGVIDLLIKSNVKTYSESLGCAKCSMTGKAKIVQPYAEYLLFTSEIKDKLVECSRPHEMEKILKNECYAQGTNMELSVIDAIRRGDLHPLDLTALD